MNEEPTPPGAKRSTRSPLVLIIEEEESIRSLLCRVLEEDGCAVVSASNAPEAIALLEAHPDSVDLVIADIAGPRVRGPGGLTHRLPPTTKVLLLSIGTVSSADLKKNEEAPFLLHRPFRAYALRDKVRELLGDLRGPASKVPSPGGIGK